MANITPITQYYTIDLSSNNNFVQIPVVQGDGNNTRFVYINLIQNGLPYTINADATIATIVGTKPDTKEVWNECEIENNYIKVRITYQMTAVAGRSDYEIMLLEKTTNNSLKSFPFILIVTPASYDTEYMKSSNEFGFIIDAGSDAQRYAEQAHDFATRASNSASAADSSARFAESYKDSALSAKNDAQTSAANANTSAFQSEAWAKGTKNGTAVSSSDPAYHNNSKYYADQAAESASAASSSATAAETSKSNAYTFSNNAAGSASSAATSRLEAEAWAKGTKNGTAVQPTDQAYQNNAKYYADQAASSETNAATSEANAATSATNAATSETNAAASETNAGASETSARNSADTAAEILDILQNFSVANFVICTALPATGDPNTQYLLYQTSPSVSYTPYIYTDGQWIPVNVTNGMVWKDY